MSQPIINTPFMAIKTPDQTDRTFAELNQIAGGGLSKYLFNDQSYIEESSTEPKTVRGLIYLQCTELEGLRLFKAYCKALFAIRLKEVASHTEQNYLFVVDYNQKS
jgi:hypothetical protein